MDSLITAAARALVAAVMIGADLRVLPEHAVLFERVVNAVRRTAPTASLCFNSRPDDTAEAVKRCL